jgi:transcriptional regulator with XRE-family HTH domain
MLPMEKEAFLKILGERIREIRIQKSMSQKQLAHSIGKDQQSIQRLEAGNINPSAYYLHQICSGLGVEIQDIFDGVK